MPEDARWRRGQSRDRLLSTALTQIAAHGPTGVSGRSIARAAKAHHEQVQQMFGSFESLITSALMVERDRFIDEAFGSSGLPDPLAIAEYPEFWRAMVWTTIDPGPVELEVLTANGPASLLRDRLGVANPKASAATLDGVVAAWAVGPLGALVFRAPLQRGLGIDDTDWDWAWRRLRRRMSALIGAGHNSERAQRRAAITTVPARAVDAPSRQRLVDAGRALLASRLERAVTGRELAEQAGVNYGLVNHYFGSKDAVFDEALQQMHQEFLRDVVGLDDAAEPFAMLRHRAFLRAWASRLLTGVTGDGFELVGMQRLRARVTATRALAADDVEGIRGAAADCMAAVALQLGWAVAEPLVAVSITTSAEALLIELGKVNAWLLRG